VALQVERLAVKITTNNVPRFTIDGFELTAKAREQFDYLNWPAIDERTDSATFFRYKGEVYDLSQFMHTDEEGWDGYLAFSWSCGLLVRLVDDDSVIVAFFSG
jgi:hypothetical protein